MLNEIAEYAGAAIANKVMERKKNNIGVSVYGRLFKMIRHVMDDPEGAELTLKCIDKEMHLTVYPEGAKANKGFTARVFVFGDEEDLDG